MPQIVQANGLNPLALTVPDLYVAIQPPQPVLNGVPSNIVGIVGTATWGPVNSPVTVGSPAEATQNFGLMQPRKYDLGTGLYCAALQGASAFVAVRVTDGTDAAASTTITCANAALATALAAAINNGVSNQRGPSNMVIATASGSTLTVTSKYTGTAGNNIVATVGPGAAANSSSISFSLNQLGLVPETFNNVGATSSAASSAALTGDRLRMFEVVGPENSKNEPYLGYAALAFHVCSIDDEKISRPASKLQLEGLIQQLGDEGMEAVGEELQKLFGHQPTAAEELEQIKN